MPDRHGPLRSFVQEKGELTLEQIQERQQERLNDAILQLDPSWYESEGGDGEPPEFPEGVLVSENLDGREGYNSISAGIEAAPSEGTVFVESGTYNEQVVIEKQGLSLVGVGPGEVQVRYDTGTGQNVLALLADDVTVRGIRFTNTYFAQGASLIGGNAAYTFNQNVTLQNVILEQQPSDESQVSNNQIGFLVDFGGSATIVNSTIRNNYNGIWVARGSATVDECNIVNNLNYGVYNDTGTTIDATNNWWGDVSGPPISADIDGDDEPEDTNKASNNVDYQPVAGSSY